MKLVIFNEHVGADSFQNIIIGHIKRIVGEKNVLIWSQEYQKNFEYFIKNKDSRMYEGVLNYCEENNVEFLYITYLTNPELLLAELNYRGKVKTKISFLADWRLIEISKPRQLAVSEILKKESVYKMFIHSSLGRDSSYGGTVESEFFKGCAKIKKFYSPIYVESIKPQDKKVAREKYNLPQNKFILLFFGAMYYGKGIDLLLEAMKKVGDDVLLFIASGEGRINFSLDTQLCDKYNIRWTREDPPDEQLSELFAAADAVALPYRSTYKNCGSSVLVQACQAHRPVLMPYITPFKEIVNKYNLGLTFEAENIDDIVRAINKIKEYKKVSGFDDYLSNLQTWEEHVKEII